MPQELLTVPQAAEILQVSVSAVWWRVYIREIPSIKLNGVRRIYRAEVEKWKEKKKQRFQTGEFFYDSLGRIRPRSYR